LIENVQINVTNPPLGAYFSLTSCLCFSRSFSSWSSSSVSSWAFVKLSTAMARNTFNNVSV